MTIKTTAKESFDLYEGYVEDTADPKKSQRVKVRVVGVHEYEGEGENRVGVPPNDIWRAPIISPCGFGIKNVSAVEWLFKNIKDRNRIINFFISILLTSLFLNVIYYHRQLLLFCRYIYLAL